MEKDEQKEKISHDILFRKYEILEQLGQGTEGKVYLARDLHLDRMAAVKERIRKEEKAMPEVKLLKELEHPGLPVIYDFFRQEDWEYLVMEYVEGITLRAYLQKNGKVDLNQAVKWAIELCDILSYLHRRGQAVIYRDLKPENIMIRPDGRIKLIDLGTALCDGFEEERSPDLAGTPGYCPREQWEKKRGDRTWDTYALCAVLHEMLTGKNPLQPPFVRLPVREYDRSLPKGLEQVIERGCCENNAGRYQTMEELRGALLHDGKAGWQEKLFQYAKRGIVYSLFLTGMGTLFIPLYIGVEKSRIPFPFLCKPILLTIAAVVLDRFFQGQGGGAYLRRQEKTIWLTEKKFSGLYVILLFLLGSMLGGMMNQNISYAEEKAETLWVEMRDDLGRKMLLKDGAVYEPKECVRFEIPRNSLPGEEISMQIVAEGEGGNRYVSRVFLIGGRS